MLRSVKLAQPFSSVTFTLPSSNPSESPDPFLTVAVTVQLVREPCPRVVTRVPSMSISLSLGCDAKGTVSLAPPGSVTNSSLAGIRKLNTLLGALASCSAWISSYRLVELSVMLGWTARIQEAQNHDWVIVTFWPHHNSVRIKTWLLNFTKTWFLKTFLTVNSCVKIFLYKIEEQLH